MPNVHLGGKDEPPIALRESRDLLVVRTRSGESLARSAGPVSAPVTAELSDGVLVAEYPEANVEVYRVPTGRGVRTVAQRKAALRQHPDVRFAGGVLVDAGNGEPVLYTENLFIKFQDDADHDECLAVIDAAGLTVKQEVTYAANAYFTEAPEGTGQRIFEIAAALLRRPDVEYCHPELIRPRARKQVFPQQWHLARTTISGRVIDASASVAAAHATTRGEGVVIAIVDDGVDIDHPEFAQPGKIVAPRDVTEKSNDPRPRDPSGGGRARGENHGTACAGVACASGVLGASGVAPAARLMPIRLASGLGSQAEADAFVWAANNGADVISCSWGPADGEWWNDADPQHRQRTVLPASTRLAIDYATTAGRAGKGCVILFAAGNGNESADLDGYVSYARVTAVAATNDRGSRSVYSDFGKAVWCSFPSNDFEWPERNRPAPLTPGIWTTDRAGRAGYNNGQLRFGDAQGNFCNDFGRTSSACPGATGVAALILAVNPDLTWMQVKELLKACAERVDPAGGAYDATGHSVFYGYGRLSAARAVELARPQPRSIVRFAVTVDLPIPDLGQVLVPVLVAEATPIAGFAIALEIRHDYVSDLEIRLEPPPGSGLKSVLLFNRSGGAQKNLVRTFDGVSTPGLRAYAGKVCRGLWTLRVRDAAAGDTGTIVSVGIALTLPRAAPRAADTPPPAGAAKGGPAREPRIKLRPMKKEAAARPAGRGAGRKVKVRPMKG